MKYVRSAHGEIYKIVGVFIFSIVSFFLSCTVPSGSLARALNITSVPCLGLGILSGFLYIFWIALAREIYGKGNGTLVAVLAVSFILLKSPWYGISQPIYFGVFGFLSFLAMGFLTDFINGGVGSIACLAINWTAFTYFKGVKPMPVWGVIIFLSFLSGLIFDFLAKFVARFIEPAARKS